MKKLKVLNLIVFLIAVQFSGCEKVPVPVANFTMSPTTFGIGETVIFNNTSLYATDYFWDFGDGTISTGENPTHAFSEYGTYTIELTATGEGGTDTKSVTIYMMEPSVFRN